MKLFKLTNLSLFKTAISSIAKCRSIKDHYAIEQVIKQKLFTINSRPICVLQRLEFISRLEKEEKFKLVITPIDQPEPIYTGLPIKLIKKRKLNLLDIETQQVSFLNTDLFFISIIIFKKAAEVFLLEDAF